MAGIFEVRIDSLLVIPVDSRSESRKWKWNNSRIRWSITNQIKIYKSITNRIRKQMQTLEIIWWNSETHHISMPNFGKRKIYKETW